jgi:hypothetical protein
VNALYLLLLALQPSLHLLTSNKAQLLQHSEQNSFLAYTSGSTFQSAEYYIIHSTSTNLHQNNKTTNNMLRRAPTAITLTTEDVIVYEDNRAREALLEEQAAIEAAQAKAQSQVRHATPQKNQNLRDPNDELRPLPPDRTRAPQKSREERLGLGGGSSSRG